MSSSSSRKRAKRGRSGNPAVAAEQEAADQGVVWVRTEPTVDGAAYVVTLDLDDDTSVTLQPREAMVYAMAVIRAATTAAHDAAVYATLLDKVGDQVAAFNVVRDLRRDRPEVGTGTALRLVPGVNPKAEPFLQLHIGDRTAGQWEVGAAMSHALGVLQSVAVADLDGAYYRLLRGQIELEEPVARGAVGALYAQLERTMR